MDNNLQILIASVGTMALLGLIAGTILAAAARIFAVKTDPRIEEVEKELPGSNCGACGYAGCNAYAEALITKGVSAGLCRPGGEAVAKKIAEIAGVKEVEVTKAKAVILCGAGRELCAERADYSGEKTCRADAATSGGSSACAWGCLAHGDCASVCPVGAIKLNGKLPPVIDRDRCIGCGKCVAACPRHLIVLEDEKNKVFVLCSSRDPGAEVRKICKVGCIGCRLCVKFSQNESMTMEGRLPEIHYDRGDIGEQAISKCPQKTIVRCN